jgi:hypothetical protein
MLYKSEKVDEPQLLRLNVVLTYQQDVGKPVDTLPLANSVREITDSPEEVSIAHSFKIGFLDEEKESYLFYCDEKVRRYFPNRILVLRRADPLEGFVQEDKELLISGLALAAKI